jgi:hypothetical protein
VSWPKASEAEKLSEKKKSTPIRLDNGVNLIPMWNRLQQRRKAGVGSASERTNSSGVLKGMFSRTAKFLHLFTMDSGLIAAMGLRDEEDTTAGSSAAFAHRS